MSAENQNLEILEKLALSDRELLIEIGEVDTYKMSPADALRTGIAVYYNIKQKLRIDICSNQTIKTHFQKDSDQLVLVSALADLISDQIFKISPITVAVLLVREGLKNLCGETWENNNAKE